MLPITLENLLLERFDRLDQSARSVLEAASVVGPSFSAHLVSQVTGLNGTAIECFASLERKDLIVLEPGRDIYRFKHALVQDAIYNRLLSAARQELHEKVANTIEEQGSANLNEFVDSLADHYNETSRAEKTVRYMALAGAKSLQVYSLEEAERRFRRVIDLIDSTPGCADDTFLADVLLKLAAPVLLQGTILQHYFIGAALSSACCSPGRQAPPFTSSLRTGLFLRFQRARAERQKSFSNKPSLSARNSGTSKASDTPASGSCFSICSGGMPATRHAPRLER